MSISAMEDMLYFGLFLCMYVLLTTKLQTIWTDVYGSLTGSDCCPVLDGDIRCQFLLKGVLVFIIFLS